MFCLPCKMLLTYMIWTFLNQQGSLQAFNKSLRLGSAVVAMRWLGFAHICIWVINLIEGDAVETMDNFLVGHRFNVDLQILNPEILFKYKTVFWQWWTNHFSSSCFILSDTCWSVLLAWHHCWYFYSCNGKCLWSLVNQKIIQKYCTHSCCFFQTRGKYKSL